MGYYSSTIQALAADPFGEAAHARLTICKAGLGENRDYTEFGPTEILDLTPIRRSCGRRFGTVEGTQWTARLSDPDQTLTTTNYLDGWCAVEIGFPGSSQWALGAQGIVVGLRRDTRDTILVTVNDPLGWLINFELSRDMGFFTGGYASNLYAEEKADSSDGYNNDYNGDGVEEGVAVNNSAYTSTETVIIEFTSSTAFKAIFEDSSEQTGFTISSDANIWGLAGSSTNYGYTIEADGWGSTYATGDRFIFYGTEAYASADLRPIPMIQELIETICDLEVYDVVNNEYYTSPRYDTTNWTALAGDSDYQEAIAGTWKKGTKVLDMIEDLLKVLHGSIYCAPTGQIGLWILQPATSAEFELNGSPAAGVVDILDPSSIEDSTAQTIDVVTYDFLELTDGREASLEAVAGAYGYDRPRRVVISCGWRVAGTLVDLAASRYITRFSGPRREVLITATVKAAFADLAEGVTVTDPVLGLDTERLDITQMEVDVLANIVRLTAEADPAVTGDYAIVGTSTVGGSEVVW